MAEGEGQVLHVCGELQGRLSPREAGPVDGVVEEGGSGGGCCSVCAESVRVGEISSARVWRAVRVACVEGWSSSRMSVESGVV